MMSPLMVAIIFIISLDNNGGTMDDLINTYLKFIKDNDLPLLCAQDLLQGNHDTKLTASQFVWLIDFVKQWEEVTQ